MQGSCIVLVGGANMIQAKNGEQEDTELALVDEKVHVGGQQGGVCRNTGGGQESEKERDRVGKSLIESQLRAEESIKVPTTGWVRSSGPSKGCSPHTRRNSSSSRLGVNEKIVELGGIEKCTASKSTVGKEIDAVGQAESSEGGMRKSLNVVDSINRLDGRLRARGGAK
jgi:hypothetical protein